jgi:Winged helix domain, variant/ATPase family associated with various cellular activities (AAA)
VTAALEALERLDRLLGRAVRAASRVHGVEPGTDPHRGLYVTPEDARRLLDREPGTPLFSVKSDVGTGLLDEFRRRFELTAFDLDVVLIALAPEVDLRYERIYAYLHDDVTRRRPSVDLALDLLCQTPEEKIAQRARFAPDAPLVASRLLRLVPEHAEQPLIGHALVLDEQVVRTLLGVPGGDARLIGIAQLVEPGDPHGDERVPALAALVEEARREQRRLILSFEGRPRSGRRRAALDLAASLSERLLDIDLGRVRDDDSLVRMLRLSLGEARLRHALPYVHGLGAQDERAGLLAERFARHEGLCVVAADARPAWLPPGAVSIEFGPLARDARLTRWRARATATRAAATASDLDALASRFRFTAGQIDDACEVAEARAHWRGALEGERVPPSSTDLFAGARAMSSANLGRLATKIDPSYGWDDIVLPADHLEQLREIVAEASHGHVVYGDWGFGRKLSLGKGLNVLFSGSPGTGKTMAAEVIAHALRLDLYKIDLSQIVSKYIGETERNLAEVFREAASTSAVLFFDEADALFGKRSEVKDAHDRYANIEIAYLLQKMEEYEGVVILATNLRRNVDQAFLRRLHHIVEFPDPDEAHRRRIWEVTFPPEAPLGDDVDFGFLARTLELPGGNIKNMALAAAFRAASEGDVIRMPHFELAARREFEKLGQGWNDNLWQLHGAVA